VRRFEQIRGYGMSKSRTSGAKEAGRTTGCGRLGKDDIGDAVRRVLDGAHGAGGIESIRS